MKEYRTELKLAVVESFLASDGGAKLPSRRGSVPEKKIRTWVIHFRPHGLDGLRPKRSVYSAQLKLQVLSHQDREQLSSRQVAAIYDIRNPNQVVVWRRQLDTAGVAALESKDLAQFDSMAQLEAGVEDYIHHYNHERIKLGLQRLSPVDYRLINAA